jgi:hypothetical protein
MLAEPLRLLPWHLNALIASERVPPYRGSDRILIGLFTIRLVITGMASLGAPFWVQNLIVGLLLIFVIVAEATSAAFARSRARTRRRAAEAYAAT